VVCCSPCHGRQVLSPAMELPVRALLAIACRGSLQLGLCSMPSVSSLLLAPWIPCAPSSSRAQPPSSVPVCANSPVCCCSSSDLAHGHRCSPSCVAQRPNLLTLPSLTLRPPISLLAARRAPLLGSSAVVVLSAPTRDRGCVHRVRQRSVADSTVIIAACLAACPPSVVCCTPALVLAPGSR
jgi:hypothetical protein